MATPVALTEGAEPNRKWLSGAWENKQFRNQEIKSALQINGLNSPSVPDRPPQQPLQQYTTLENHSSYPPTDTRPQYDQQTGLIAISRSNEPQFAGCIADYQCDDAASPETITNINDNKLIEVLSEAKLLSPCSETPSSRTSRHQLHAPAPVPYNDCQNPIRFGIVDAQRTTPVVTPSKRSHEEMDRDGDETKGAATAKTPANNLDKATEKNGSDDKNAWCDSNDLYEFRSAAIQSTVPARPDQTRTEEPTRTKTEPEADLKTSKPTPKPNATLLSGDAKDMDDKEPKADSKEGNGMESGESVDESDKDGHSEIPGILEPDNMDFELDAEMQAEVLDRLFLEMQDKCPRTEHLTKDLWASMCSLFKRDQKDFVTEVNLPGLSRDVKLHQLLWITWALEQNAKFGGGFNADEMGLGKTTEALLLLYVNALLERNKHDVASARRAKTGAHRLHGEDGTCPSADKWPMRCSCEKDSPTKRFTHRAGPALVIVPPQLVPNWKKEFEAMFDKDYKGPVQMRLFVGHLSAQNSTTPVSTPASHAKLLLTNKKDKAAFLQSRFIVLTTPLSWKNRVHKHLQKAVPGIHVQWSIIVVDEMHANKHQRTGLHSIVLGKEVNRDAYLWAMSGTPWERGPLDMIPYVRWLEARWKLAADEGDDTADPELVKAREKCSVSALKKLQREFKILMKPDSSTTANEKGDLLQAAAKTWGDILACLMIRRTAESMGMDGKPLVPLPPLDVRDVHLTPRPVVQKYLDRYWADIKAQIQKEFDNDYAAWVEAGSKSEPPTFPKATFTRLISISRPVYSFPTLGILRRAGRVPKDWTVDTIKSKRWFDPGCKDSPIRKEIDAIVKYSERMNAIESVIQEMDAEDAKSKPGDRRQKLVILSAYPINAIIIWEWLRKKYPKHLVGILGSFIDAKDRPAIVNGFQEELVHDSGGNAKKTKDGQPVYVSQFHPSILVGTVGVVGVGLTLHRARRLILVEPQFTATWEAQTNKRIHRIGQPAPCIVYRLLLPTVTTEKLVVERTSLRRLVAEIVGSTYQTRDEEGLGKDGDVEILDAPGNKPDDGMREVPNEEEDVE